MPVSLILGQASSFADLYNYGLSTRIIPGQRVWPTNYELAQDPQFWEKAGRDPVVAHATTYRRHLVSGPSYVVAPGGTDEKSKTVAAIFEDLLDRVENFSTARFNLADAVFRGSSYARVFGKYEKFKAGGLPYAQRWWCPTRLKDFDSRRVGRWVTNEGRVDIKHWDHHSRNWVKIPHPEWIVKHVYADREETLGFGVGVYEALYYPLLTKARIQQEMAAAGERWGQGLTTVQLDPEAKGLSLADAATAYLDVLEKTKGRHFIAYDARDKLEVLPGPGQGWQILSEYLNYLDTKITILLLGSLLPTQASSGGSYALAQVQESSTDALVRYDRALLSETMTRDLLGLVWDLNRPALANLGLLGAEMPVFQILDDKTEDPAAMATVIQTLLASGIPLRKDEVYAKTGFSVPSDRDDVIEPTIAASAMGADPAAIGLPPENETSPNGQSIPPPQSPNASPSITATQVHVKRVPSPPTNGKNGANGHAPSAAALAAHEGVRQHFATIPRTR